MPFRSKRNLIILWVATVFAVMALVLAVLSLFWLANVASSKESDRIRADVETCESGNALRVIIKQAHIANYEINRVVLEDHLVPDAIRTHAKPYEEAYLKAISSIRPRDCTKIPGYDRVRIKTDGS